MEDKETSSVDNALLNVLTKVSALLAEHDVYQVGQSQSTSTRYYGRFRSDIIRVRVSDHETQYPKTLSTTILIRPGMTDEEISSSVHAALNWLRKEEDDLYEDMS